MNVITYSHNHGEKVVPSTIKNPLIKALIALDFHITPLSAPKLRKTLLGIIKELGWTNRVPVAAGLNITITAVNDDTGLCLQLGNMARFYADLLKLQSLHITRRITNGIYIIPTKSAAHTLGHGIAEYERMVQELEYYQTIVTIPLFVIGMEEG